MNGWDWRKLIKITWASLSISGVSSVACTHMWSNGVGTVSIHMTRKIFCTFVNIWKMKGFQSRFLEYDTCINPLSLIIKCESCLQRVVGHYVLLKRESWSTKMFSILSLALNSWDCMHRNRSDENCLSSIRKDFSEHWRKLIKITWASLSISSVSSVACTYMWSNGVGTVGIHMTRKIFCAFVDVWEMTGLQSRFLEYKNKQTHAN